ncbi:hypothetical protein O6H91_14G077800 [Diphasiastrum complanatum]|uniref:Uncharacterized protein n=1 Tax=Diphasiastrum complanatum TaxID=34168 RepID=A0ACC2BR36_DIPCM|nr:hypothetical protein O6H91_14G077800 [Diphasiastrum complanatum]
MQVGVEDDDGDRWIPFSERSEWSDVQPVPQDDGPYPVVSIAYTSQFRETMDYFRAVLARDERSDRSLELTEEAIHMNAGNYTVWHFRRLVLESLGKDLWKELYFIQDVAKSNHKNYQLWHHRRWVAEKLGVAVAPEELRFTELVLASDAKNYHAWSHRQALGGWEAELSFCSMLLQEDIYNNSAWNQRFFVIKNSPLLEGLDSMRESEVEYCINAIKLAPLNESSWTYLRGLFGNDTKSLGDSQSIGQVCFEELARDRCCIPALSFLLDLVCYGFQPTVDDCKILDSSIEILSSLQLALYLCERLEVVDAIRACYWAWRRSLLPAIIK